MSKTFATPTRRTFKRITSVPTISCRSSDTEDHWTPPRKRLRCNNDEDDERFSSPSTSSLASSPYTTATFSSPASSTRSSVSPSKKRRRTVSTEEYNFTAILRRCNSETLDAATIRDIKAFPRSERDSLTLIQTAISRIKSSVKFRLDRARQKVLETELYLEWLQEFEFIISAVENLLSAKLPGTRKRVTGLGRLSFTILYQLMDEFISEVDAHHDGWSCSSNSPTSSKRSSMYPQTMTIIEESQDNSTDARGELAVELAEECLYRYDKVMADAVWRYKTECGRNNVKLADAIGSKEYALSRACCLLCEQTGFGGEEDGDTLLGETRKAMQEWKEEFGSDAAEDVEDDELESD